MLVLNWEWVVSCCWWWRRKRGGAVAETTILLFFFSRNGLWSRPLQLRFGRWRLDKKGRSCHGAYTANEGGTVNLMSGFHCCWWGQVRSAKDKQSALSWHCGCALFVCFFFFGIASGQNRKNRAKLKSQAAILPSLTLDDASFAFQALQVCSNCLLLDGSHYIVSGFTLCFALHNGCRR